MKLRRASHEDQGGAAYVEFLIAFIPLFVLFMGMVQMALMYAADLVVQHAASRAARAAAVVLDDDPQYYEDAPRRRVDPSGSTSQEGAGGLLDLFGGGGESPGGGSGSTGGPRLSAIRQAASIPLMAISPSLDQLTGTESIGTAVGSPESRAATGALAYNNSAMGVTFPSAPGASDYRTSWPADERVQVTTRVTYLFHCGIPLANRLMCESYTTLQLGPAAAAAEGIIQDMNDGTMSLEEATSRLERIDQSSARHERDEAAIEELESSGSSNMMYLTAATGSRFKVLRGEASMPLQFANYCYPGGGC